MNNRHILWILSSLVVTAPIVTLATQEQSKIITNQTNTHQKNQFSNDEMHIIALDNLDSVEQMLDQINKVTNIFMPESILNLSSSDNMFTSKLSASSFAKLRAYTQNINFSFDKITFMLGDKAFVPNLDPIKKQIQLLKNKMELGYNQVLSEKASAKLLIPSAHKAPNMAALLKEMMGYPFAFHLKGLASIPDNGYLNYLELMEALHTFTWHLHQSAVYRDWVSSKNPQYKLAKGSFIFFKSPPKIYYVSDGAGFDKKPRLSLPSPSQPEELNNLEAQLVLSMAHVYGN